MPRAEPRPGTIDNRFVHLVLYARIGQGTWSAEDELVAFTVFVRDPILVRINYEPLAWAPPKTTRAFSAGETIEPSDLLTGAVAVDTTWETGASISGERDNGRWLLRLNLGG